MSLLRKTVLWTAAALLVLLVSAAILLPRVINTEAVKTAIERTISRDLGGTLTYDRVGLSILPRPRIILRKPRIEIPRKVTAGLDSLDIYPAIFPLLTGTLRIDEVHLVGPRVTLLLPEEPATGKRRKEPASSFGPSPEEVLAVAAKNMPGIDIAIDGGAITVMRRSEQVLSVRTIEARAVFVPAQRGEGITNPPADAVFRISGSVSCSADWPGLPAGPLWLTVEHFEARPRTFSFTGAHIRVLDLSLSLSGSLDEYFSNSRKADVNLSGTAGPNALLWFRDSASLPSLPTPRAPLAFSAVHATWDAGTLQVTGSASIKNGPSLAFDVQRSPQSITLKHLIVRDKESKATITFQGSERIVDLSFAGNLTRETMNNLLEQARIQFGWLKGDLKARLPLDRLADASAEGTLEIEQMAVPWKKQVPFMIDDLVLHARGRTVELAPAAVTVGGSKAVFTGGIEAGKDGLVLDIDAASRDIDWNDLRETFFSPEERHEVTGAEGPTEPKTRTRKEAISVRGVLRVDIDVLRGTRYRFGTVRGTISFEQDRTRYEVREATFCGIRIAGTVAVARKENDISLKLSANEQQLGGTLTCLAGADLKVSGTYDLSGSIAGKGPNEGLLSALQGPIAFVSKNGRVYNDLLVVPILKYKRTAELLGDKSEDAKKNGIPYDTFGIRGTIAHGTLAVSEGVIKSPIMNLAARGNIDMMNDRLDITVLMAPFRTVDAVVKHIPLLGKVLGGTLVTVPLGLKGPFKDVKVTALPPSAISEGLVGIMRRTLDLPFTVLEDLAPPERSAATPSMP